MILLIPTVFYFVVLAIVPVRYDRNLLPLFPALAVFASWPLARLEAILPRSRDARVGSAGLALATFVAVAHPATEIVKSNVSLTRAYTSARALAWVESNVPRGSRIVREFMTPQVTPPRWQVAYVFSLGQFPLEAYRAAGAHYLIANDDADRTFLDPRGHNHDKTAIAKNLRDILALPEVARFTPNDNGGAGPTVRILDARRR